MNPSIVAPSLAAFVSGAFTVSAIRDYWFGASSMRWPTTRARILSSMPLVVYGSRWHTNVADVTYAYRVGDRPYTSNRYSFSGFGVGLEASRAVAGRHTADDIITIYYHPRHPGRSCIQPGVGAANGLQILFGLIIFLPMLAWWLSALAPAAH